jgi:electron transport complex protein RnfC
MIEKPEIIVEGLKIVLSMFKNAKGIIAVEDNKMDAILKLRKCASKEKNIEVKSLFTKYPQGGERSLIYALTKKKLNSKMLPSDVGCIVQNVDTIFAIHNAIVNKSPLINRVVTISGDGVRYTGNYLVLIGVDYEKLLRDNSEMKKNVKKIISGGPMMGTAISDLSIPVTKGTSAILCFKNDAVKDTTPSNCINCGRCVSACPSGIVPCRLAKCADAGDAEGFKELNGMDCVECGCCTYICPAKRQVTQSIRTMKRNIIEKKK